jgi:MFS family permease
MREPGDVVANDRGLRVRIRLGLPEQIVPIFWGLVFLEGTFGAYLSIWPLWIEHLGAPVTIVGLVLGSGGFIRLFVLGPSGAIADRLGYRRAILFCRVGTVIGLLSAAVATHWTQLVVMLVGGAIGELVFPLLQVLVAAQSGEQRMRAFALVFTVGPSAALIVSPLISGALVALFGMRAAFVFAAVCSIVSLYFLSKIEEPSGAVMHGSAGRSGYRDAIQDPGVRLIAILLFVTVFSLSLGIAFIPTFLEDVRGMDAALIATLSAGAAVGSACFGLAVARIHRLQRAPFLAVGMAVAATAIGFVIFRSTALPALLAIAFFCRGGLFSAWAMLSAALGDLAPATHRARAFALVEMTGGIAFSLGPIVAGQLYARRATLSFDVAILLSLALVPVLFAAQRKVRVLHRTHLEQAAIAIDGESPAVAS